MNETLLRYLRRYFPVDTLFPGVLEKEEKASFNAQRLDPRFQLLMAALRFSPWLCAAAFAFSFLVIGLRDFDLPFFAAFHARNQAWLDLMNILAVSGLIGFGTNWLAIRMLFRPVERRPLWGQGLIPAQRERIIYSLAHGMHQHILSQELIRSRIEASGLPRRLSELALRGAAGLLGDTELREELRGLLQGSIASFLGQEAVRQEIHQLIDQRLERNLNSGVKRLLLQTYKRFNREDYQAVIDRLVDDLPAVSAEVFARLEPETERLAEWLLAQQARSEQQIMQVLTALLDRLDIPALLAGQMAHFDESRLERMIREATNEQLLYIQYLGAVLGMIGGLLIWKPALMGLLFLLGFALLYAADEALYRLRRQRAAQAEAAESGL